MRPVSAPHITNRINIAKPTNANMALRWFRFSFLGSIKPSSLLFPINESLYCIIQFLISATNIDKISELLPPPALNCVNARDFLFFQNEVSAFLSKGKDKEKHQKKEQLPLINQKDTRTFFQIGKMPFPFLYTFCTNVFIITCHITSNAKTRLWAACLHQFFQ